MIVKMGLDITPTLNEKAIVEASDNLNLLVDIEVLLSLTCFIPLLNVVYSLMKFFQACDIFVSNFMQAAKIF